MHDKERTKMRGVDVVGEAFRNLRYGVTRAVLWAVLLIFVTGLCAAADVVSITGLSRQASDYQAAGGATWILTAANGVNGSQCAALSESTDVIGAAAVSQSSINMYTGMGTQENLTLSVLPRSPIPIKTATSGIGQVLGQPGALSAGVLFPDSVAESLGVGEGDSVTTADGHDMQVAGVYGYPDDGRNRELGYVAIEQVAPVGTFDECWITVWPPDQAEAHELLWTALLSSADPQQVTVSQLNPSMGLTFAPNDSFTGRITQYIWLLVLLGSIIIGAASVWIRRLEFASALHAGVVKSQQLIQILLETLFWAFVAGVITAAIVLYLSMWHNPDFWSSAFLAGLRVILAGVLGACVGACAIGCVISENQLFKYFKQR
jgi:hypothetical protein